MWISEEKIREIVGEEVVIAVFVNNMLLLFIYGLYKLLQSVC